MISLYVLSVLWIKEAFSIRCELAMWYLEEDFNNHDLVFNLQTSLKSTWLRTMHHNDIYFVSILETIGTSSLYFVHDSLQHLINFYIWQWFVFSIKQCHIYSKSKRTNFFLTNSLVFNIYLRIFSWEFSFFFPTYFPCI